MSFIVRHAFKLIDITSGSIIHTIEFDETFLFERAREYAKQYAINYCKKHNIPLEYIKLK